MRLHVISLPHTNTTHTFDHCAFTAKVRKFADMMSPRHELILYGPEGNEAQCSEHVTCLSHEEQTDILGNEQWWLSGAVYNVSWDPNSPLWKTYNRHVIAAVRERIEPEDIICHITGWSAHEVIEAFPKHTQTEFGVGYPGIHTSHRVFESYCWMHVVYASLMGAAGADGAFFDAVIPNYYDVDEFPAGEPGEDLLFMSRMTQRKGYQVAIDMAERTGRRLLVAGGPGDRPQSRSVEYLGLVDHVRRGELLASARAVIVPTLYVEPFGGVAAEAMLCGTPVITTDWGAFPEYVEQGVDGYRCRMMREFTDAVDAVEDLDREQIRERSRARFGFEAVGAQYDAYLDRLSTLRGEGFYAPAAVAPKM